MIEIQGVKKSFGALRVLRGIDLTVNKGEVISVIGASGSGKSPSMLRGTETSNRAPDLRYVTSPTVAHAEPFHSSTVVTPSPRRSIDTSNPLPARITKSTLLDGPTCPVTGWEYGSLSRRCVELSNPTTCASQAYSSASKKRPIRAIAPGSGWWMAELMAKGRSPPADEITLDRFREGRFIDESVAAGVAH